MSRPLARLGLTAPRLAARPVPIGARAFSASSARMAAPAPQEKNDYANGPSAIDKAAQLFFFTEIVRGECTTSLRAEGPRRNGSWVVEERGTDQRWAQDRVSGTALESEL